MSGCGNCAGDCGACGKTLTVSDGELKILELLGQVAFLPVARKIDDPAPVCLEEGVAPGPAVELLEKKGLISLDYGQPLKNTDWAAYGGYPVRGSMGLTQRGQAVLELIEVQGIQGE